ncbi:MAG: glycosyltransferase family 39 protein [Tildeniella nuda ZEHNDER 1965/U140]|jgi:hypothetical protein|nr:glycosyltransferase family 39 protein [Tildeniella nuda ZEHNDER 1965/U140]
MKLSDKFSFLNFNQLTSSTLLDRLSLLIVFWGIFLRISQYLNNRSLWGDEVMLVLNLLNRSYLELLRPLDYDQAAPPGFLWIEKTAIQVFGNSEYSLRLFPLIAGIVSMIAFYYLSKWAVSTIAVPIALILFACSKFILYFSTETKQYSSDVMLALLLCLLLIPLRGKLLAKGRSLLLGVIGAIVVWFSHPAVFVLAGIETANWITLSSEKRKPVLINRLPSYCLWIASFATLYFIITANVMTSRNLQRMWGREYPETIFDLPWLFDSFGRVFYNPLGYAGPFDGIALIAFVIGCFAFFRLNRKVELLLLMAPSFTTLAAAYLHKYPFLSRLILFLAPFFILVIAEGIGSLLAQFSKRKAVGIVGVVLASLLLIPPLQQTTSFIFHPEKKEELRPVLAYVKTRQQPGDILYVGDAFNNFRYYADKFGYTKADYVGNYDAFLFHYKRDFSPQIWHTFMQANHLKPGQRLWFLFAGVNEKGRGVSKARLDSIGQRLDSIEQPGASAYLYQLK